MVSTDLFIDFNRLLNDQVKSGSYFFIIIILSFREKYSSLHDIFRVKVTYLCVKIYDNYKVLR